jgi:hypothetical protein
MRYLRGPLINVYVGPKRCTFIVHTELLQNASDFFKKMIRPDGYSFDLMRIFLGSIDPNAFELFVNWLYRGTLIDLQKGTTAAQEVTAKSQVLRLVDLYLMAWNWDVYGLMNLIVDRMRARKTCNDGWFPQDLIKKIYDGTNTEDPLRLFILDSFLHKSWDWTHESRVEFLMESMMSGNHRLVAELYENLDTLCREKRGSKKPGDPSAKTKCEYHWHHDDSDCED